MNYKYLSFLLIALIFGSNINAQTIIKDKEYVSGTWKKSGSPYIIEGEAVVAVGKTLKIKAGVIVQFKTGDGRDYPESAFDVAFLRVNGTLIAKGKAKKNIVFTRKGSSGSWGVIQIADKTQNSIMSYCKVEYSGFIRTIVSNDNATGAISVYMSSPKISNCIITNSWAGINCKQGSSPLVKNNTIVSNKYGIECNTESSPKILNCIVWKNETAFYMNGGSVPSISYTLIDDNPAKYGIADDGTNLIGQNPLFKDYTRDDFTLKKNSPCKGKSNDKGNIGVF